MSSGNPETPTTTTQVAKPTTTPSSVATTGARMNKINSYTKPVGVNFNRQQREYQLFPEEYFTSTDCQVYFNDVYIEDITGLSFELNEVGEPIFGYASNTWDYFARGRRIIQGQFRIAFKEAGYIYNLMDHFGQKQGQLNTHLGYLMNNETRDIYNGYNGAPSRTFGQVLETLKDLLDRNHLDKNAVGEDTTKMVTETVGFKWPVESAPMKINQTDSDSKYQNMPSDAKGNTTAIKQLQQWLIDNNYGFDKKTFNWKVGYGGDSWFKARTWTQGSNDTNRSAEVAVAKNVANSYFTNSYINNRLNKDGSTKAGGKWYMMLRFYPDGSNLHDPLIDTLSGEAHSVYEYEFQKAVDRYPGDLDGFWMGSPDGKLRYDGRYGSGPTKAIRLLMKLAEYDDGSNGYWVSDKTKSLIEAGLTAPTGTFDFPTKLAVYAFQQDMLRAGKLSGSKYPNGEVDVATRDLMTYTREVTEVVPGQSLYKPESAFEQRMAIYEREVWGNRFTKEADDVRKLESFFYRGRRDDNDKLMTEVLFQNGIDIYINYGPLSHHIKAKFEEHNVGTTIVGGTSLADDVSFNTTVKAIRNVQITNVSQVLDPNTGYCIEEVYSFIAKDLD